MNYLEVIKAVKGPQGCVVVRGINRYICPCTHVWKTFVLSQFVRSDSCCMPHSRPYYLSMSALTYATAWKWVTPSLGLCYPEIPLIVRNWNTNKPWSVIFLMYAFRESFALSGLRPGPSTTGRKQNIGTAWQDQASTLSIQAWSSLLSFLACC